MKKSILNSIQITALLLLFACNPEESKVVTEDDSTMPQVDETGKLIPLNGAGVAIAVAAAGKGRYSVNVHASDAPSSPYADVWLDTKSSLVKFEVDDTSIGGRDPLTGNVEEVNPLISEIGASTPKVYRSGSSNLLSVYWGRWEGDYFFKEILKNDLEQEYDEPRTLPLTYVYSNNATPAVVIDDLKNRGVSRTYNLFYGSAIYYYRTTDTGEFIMTNGFGEGVGLQTVIDATMEIQFGTDANSGITNFTLTTKLDGTTDTINLKPFSAQGPNYLINQRPIPIEMEDCNFCFYDVNFDINGHVDYRLVGKNGETVIGSFEVSNTVQTFYGTFILTSIANVSVGK